MACNITRSRRRSEAQDGCETVSPWLCRIPSPALSIVSRSRHHLANLKPKVDSGFWVLGGKTNAAIHRTCLAVLTFHKGAYLDEPHEDGQALSIKGSVMLAIAESKELVLEELKKDVYSTSEVWDWNKVDRSWICYKRQLIK